MSFTLEPPNKSQWYYLKRIQSDEKQHSIIPFKKNEVLIGRGRDSNYIILDGSISRSHALFKQNGNNWTVKNLSTNGVYVNKKMVPKDEERDIEIGYIIHLGHLEKFCFRFGMKEKGKKEETEPNCTSNLVKYERNDLVFQQTALEERLGRSETQKENLLKEKQQILSSMKEERELLQRRFTEEQKELERKLKEGVLAQQNVVLEKEALAQRLQNQVEELQTRHEQEKLSLEQKLRTEEDTKANIHKEKEELAVRLQAEKENLERQLMQERKELEAKLAKERKRLQSQLLTLEEQRTRLEREVQDREQSLKLKEEQQEHLREEQRKEAENLKEEKEELLQRLKKVETNLEEKALLTSTLAGELLEKNEVGKRLEALMEDKQALEQRLNEAMLKGAQVYDLQNALDLLEAQKLSLEQEVASATSISEAARKQVVDSVSDVVENELQCPICNELFITAIMLNCSHTFCKFCIDSWKKNKKDCPNCRTPIRSETRSIVVDNFIDKIVTTLSDEMKEQRKQMIAERTADEDAAKRAEAARQEAAASNQPAARGGRGGRQNRGRNRGRGSVGTRNTRTNAQERTAASTRGANNQPQPPPPPPTPPPPPSHEVITLPDLPAEVVIHDSSPITVESDSYSSDSDSESDSLAGSENGYNSELSDSSSMSGDSSVYYGGYGRCFNCGRRGHWANGCPTR